MASVPCPNQSSAPFKEAARNYALASRQWRTLGADQEQWTDPQKQRDLAAAFLRYHAAKLSLESTTPDVSESIERRL